MLKTFTSPGVRRDARHMAIIARIRLLLCNTQAQPWASQEQDRQNA
jgi:hypothetical protein